LTPQRRSERHAREPTAPAIGQFDPGLAGDRTMLAWTRSALNLAASGVLIARAAIVAHVVALGVVAAMVMAVIAVITWRHGLHIYSGRRHQTAEVHHQPKALRLLTAATLLTATVAIVVTLAA
jgi:uncharacterized membrane protein YidH (DUF202 family)